MGVYSYLNIKKLVNYIIYKFSFIRYIHAKVHFRFEFSSPSIIVITYVFSVVGWSRTKPRVFLFTIDWIIRPATVSSLASDKVHINCFTLFIMSNLVTGARWRLSLVVGVVWVGVQGSPVVARSARWRVFLLLLFRLFTFGKSKNVSVWSKVVWCLPRLPDVAAGIFILRAVFLLTRSDSIGCPQSVGGGSVSFYWAHIIRVIIDR